jgi:hypothetical protein
MKAISLWQPWASAIALGAKTIETRGWQTGYRGPLAIHAAKRKVKRELLSFDLDPGWLAALGLRERMIAEEALSFGAVVAVCSLFACLRTEWIASEVLDAPHHREGWSAGWTERTMGDFTPGRYGWILNNVRLLKKPLPYKGMQGFFDVPDQWLERGLE